MAENRISVITKFVTNLAATAEIALVKNGEKFITKDNNFEYLKHYTTGAIIRTGGGAVGDGSTAYVPTSSVYASAVYNLSFTTNPTMVANSTTIRFTTTDDQLTATVLKVKIGTVTYNVKPIDGGLFPIGSLTAGIMIEATFDGANFRTSSIASTAQNTLASALRGQEVEDWIQNPLFNPLGKLLASNPGNSVIAYYDRNDPAVPANAPVQRVASLTKVTASLATYTFPLRDNISAIPVANDEMIDISMWLNIQNSSVSGSVRVVATTRDAAGVFIANTRVTAIYSFVQGGWQKVYCTIPLPSNCATVALAVWAESETNPGITGSPAGTTVWIGEPSVCKRNASSMAIAGGNNAENKILNADLQAGGYLQIREDASYIINYYNNTDAGVPADCPAGRIGGVTCLTSGVTNFFSYYAKTTANTAGTINYINVTAGDVIDVSVWLNMSGMLPGHQLTGNLAIISYNAAGSSANTFVGSGYDFVVGGWQRFATKYVVPAGIVRISYRISVSALNGTFVTPNTTIWFCRPYLQIRNGTTLVLDQDKADIKFIKTLGMNVTSETELYGGGTLLPDLNSVPYTGLFRFNKNALNAPPQVGGNVYGSLLHSIYNTTDFRQVAFVAGGASVDLNDGGIAYRYSKAGVWSAWQELARRDSPTFIGTPRAPTPDLTDISTILATTAFSRNLLSKYGIGIAAPALAIGDSVDDLSATGFYSVGATTLGTYPVEELNFGVSTIIQHMQSTTQSQAQMAFYRGTNKVYWRQRSSGVWGAWRQLVDTVMLNTNSGGDNLVVNSGLHATSVLNLPSDTRFNTTVYDNTVDSIPSARVMRLNRLLGDGAICQVPLPLKHGTTKVFVAPGDVYDVTCWFKTAYSTANSLKFVISWFDSANVLISDDRVLNYNHAAANTWQRMIGTVTAPATAKYMTASMWLETQAPVGFYHMADPYVSKRDGSTAIISSRSESTSSGDNLIINSGLNATGYLSYGQTQSAPFTYAISYYDNAADSIAANRVCRIERLTADANAAAIALPLKNNGSIRTACMQGETYDYSIYMRDITGVVNSFAFVFAWFTSSGTLLSYQRVSYHDATSATWQKISGSVVAPSTARFMQVYVWQESTHPIGYSYFAEPYVARRDGSAAGGLHVKADLANTRLDANSSGENWVRNATFSTNGPLEPQDDGIYSVSFMDKGTAGVPTLAPAARVGLMKRLTANSATWSSFYFVSNSGTYRIPVTPGETLDMSLWVNITNIPGSLTDPINALLNIRPYIGGTAQSAASATVGYDHALGGWQQLTFSYTVAVNVTEVAFVFSQHTTTGNPTFPANVTAYFALPSITKRSSTRLAIDKTMNASSSGDNNIVNAHICPDGALPIKDPTLSNNIKYVIASFVNGAKGVDSALKISRSSTSGVALLYLPLKSGGYKMATGAGDVLDFSVSMYGDNTSNIYTFAKFVITWWDSTGTASTNIRVGALSSGATWQKIVGSAVAPANTIAYSVAIWTETGCPTAGYIYVTEPYVTRRNGTTAVLGSAIDSSSSGDNLIANSHFAPNAITPAVDGDTVDGGNATYYATGAFANNSCPCDKTIRLIRTTAVSTSAVRFPLKNGTTKMVATPGETLDFSVWMYGDNPNYTYAKFVITWYNSAGSTISNQRVGGPTAAVTWQKVSGSVVAPALTTSFSVAAWFDDLAPVGTSAYWGEPTVTRRHGSLSILSDKIDVLDAIRTDVNTTIIGHQKIGDKLYKLWGWTVSGTTVAAGATWAWSGALSKTMTDGIVSAQASSGTPNMPISIYEQVYPFTGTGIANLPTGTVTAVTGNMTNTGASASKLLARWEVIGKIL
jgi:hypothetical protein